MLFVKPCFSFSFFCYNYDEFTNCEMGIYMLNNILGTRIKQLRKEKQLSQLDLARHLNISNTTLSQYESGKRIPGDEIKIKIAKFFNVSIDYLLGCTDVRSYNAGTEQIHKNDPRTYDRLDKSGLSEEDIKKVEEYIDLLKQKYKSDISFDK